MDNILLSRISINPEIAFGKPVIKNSRMSVKSVLEYLAGGSTTEEIIENFPFLEKEDVLACIAYASQFTDKSVQIIPLGK